MRDNLQLKTILPLNNGLFTAMERNKRYSVPWEKGQPLDTMYVAGRSGNKISSPLLRNIMQGNVMSDSELDVIADIILMQYSVPWTKLYATMSAEYDPISNYDMVETESIKDTDKGSITDDNQITYGRTENTTNTTEYGRTDNTTNTTEYGKITETDTVADGQTDNSVAGFNSDDVVKASEQSSNGTNEQRTEDSGTDKITTTETEGGSDKTTVNATAGGADKTNNTRTLDTINEVTRQLTRKGNIGVTTSQQMLQSERELWQWNFFETVFADVDKIIALKIY